MSSKLSRPLYEEETKQLRSSLLEEASKVWSLQDLTALSSLMQEPAWNLWQRYLRQLDQMVQQQVWEADTLERLSFIKGQKDAVKRMMRAPEEIARLRDQMRKDNE